MVTLTDKQKRRAITGKEAACLAETLGKYIASQLEPIKAEIAELKARPPGLVDAGVWDAEREYPIGSVVSFQGSAWTAQMKSRGVRPGDGLVWRLFVKRGRDGKDRNR